MQRNRLLNDPEVYRLPRPPLPQASPGSFAVCPACLMQGLSAQQWLWQQYLYRIAFEQAQAVATPSLLERDLLAVWN